MNARHHVITLSLIVFGALSPLVNGQGFLNTKENVENVSTLHDISSMRIEIQEFTRNLLIQQGNRQGKDLDIQVASLNNELKLAKCPGSVTHTSKGQSYGSQNLVIQSSCRTEKRRIWAIHSPVRISTLIDVVVSNHKLSRGDIINVQDLSIKRLATSGLSTNHITRIDNAIGREVKREIRAGAALRRTYLNDKDVIREGDAVALTERSAFVSTDMMVTALSNGGVGDTIKVQNRKTQRILDAEITAPGKVQYVGR